MFQHYLLHSVIIKNMYIYPLELSIVKLNDRFTQKYGFIFFCLILVGLLFLEALCCFHFAFLLFFHLLMYCTYLRQDAIFQDANGYYFQDFSSYTV